MSGAEDLADGLEYGWIIIHNRKTEFTPAHHERDFSDQDRQRQFCFAGEEWI